MSELSTPELRVERYRSLEALQRILPAWDWLLREYPLASTFSTWEWLAPWWRAFGKGRELMALGFWHGEELVGLAALSVSRDRGKGGLPVKVLRLMGDGSGDSDNLDVPVKPGSEQQVVSALLPYLETNKKLWDVFELNTLPCNSPVAALLSTSAQKQKWNVLQTERVASVVELPASWEEYLGQLSSEDQKNLNRYARRMEKRYQTRIFRITQESELDGCLEALFRLHQQRWEADGQAGSFGSEDRRTFYYDLSRALLSRGWLELWALQLDGVYAAVQYAFRYREVVYQLQEGNDPQKSSDRVGFVLRGEVMKKLIAEGVRVYDFLGGQPGYKARWGAKITHYQDLRLARAGSFGSAYLAAVQSGADAKEWLRRNLPQSAWGLLHRVNVGMRNENGVKNAPPRGTASGAPPSSEKEASQFASSPGIKKQD